MDRHEYLFSYGSQGDVGRFRSAAPLEFGRGARAVLESYRGLEMGTALCAATPGHAKFFVNTSVGRIVRPAGPADEDLAATAMATADRLFDGCRDLAAELRLPVEVVDVEVLLDGQHAFVHHIGAVSFDERPFVSEVSKRFGVHVAIHRISAPIADTDPVESSGCGPGSHGSGDGCGSCGTGGCGSCGAGGCRTATSESAGRFLALREQMARRGKIPLG